MDSNEKKLVDRILFVDGQLSQMEHMVEVLESQIHKAYTRALPGLQLALSEARSRRARSLYRRNRLIEWHDYLY